MVNELDKLRRGVRIKAMKEIVAKCKRLPNLEFKYVLEELESICSSLEKIEAEVILIIIRNHINNFKLKYSIASK